MAVLRASRALQLETLVATPLASVNASAAVFEAPPAPVPWVIGSLKVSVSCERPQGAGLATSHASDLSLRPCRPGRYTPVGRMVATRSAAGAARGDTPRHARMAVPEDRPCVIEHRAQGVEPSALDLRTELVALPVGDLDEVTTEVDA